MPLTDAEIGRVAHAANMEMQAVGGDDMPSQPWLWEPRSLRFVTTEGVRRIAAGMTAQENHARWCADKQAQGWSYGPEKDPENRKHPGIVAWEELPEHERAKTELFCAIVHALEKYRMPEGESA